MAASEKENKYQPNWKSISKHVEAPEWFRDAKFGIYFHWGPYSVPASAGHYAQLMYDKEEEIYEEHKRLWGDPKEFGYHDFIPMLTAEEFDPDDWAELFKEAGARYAGPVVEHHDGFAMWDSDITPWNAADMGPKRDITGLLAESLRKRDIRLITTFHHARMPMRLRSRKKGADPEYGSFYKYDPEFITSSTDEKYRLLHGHIKGWMSEEEWYERIWLGKLHEVIAKYHPDMIWFDACLGTIPDEFRRRFAADYLNAAPADQEVVIITKNRQMPQEVSILDIEKGGQESLVDFPWLTDDTIGDAWSYQPRKSLCKPQSMLLHSLIDIVSKNGCLLLNISPDAKGRIPEEQRAALKRLGKWLGQFGEAIYETRPWLVYGEGVTEYEEGPFAGVKTTNVYTAEHIRYTQSKDGKTIYAIVLGWPGAGNVVHLESFAAGKAGVDVDVQSVELLGAGPVEFARNADGLSTTMPQNSPDDIALVLKITCG